jgi:hypothetical protein
MLRRFSGIGGGQALRSELKTGDGAGASTAGSASSSSGSGIDVLVVFRDCNSAKPIVNKLTPTGSVPQTIPCQCGGLSGDGIGVAKGMPGFDHTVMFP